MIKRRCFIFGLICLLLDATVNGFRRCIDGQLLISNGVEESKNYSSVQCLEITNVCKRVTINAISNDGRGKIIFCCNCTYIFIYQTALAMRQRGNI